MSAGNSPAMPAFSYAQAARGLAPATPLAQVESKVSNTNSTDDKPSESELASSDSVTHTQSHTDRSEPKPSGENAPHESVSEQQSAADLLGHAESTTPQPSKMNADDIKTQSVNPAQAPSSSTQNPSPTAIHEADLAPMTNGNSESSGDGQAADSVAGERSDGNKEGKAKDADEDWEKVSVPSTPVEKELKAAPIPTVNIWQKRAEEQAKRKPTVAPRTEPAAPSRVRETHLVTNGVPGRFNGRPQGLGISDEDDFKERKKPAEATRAGQEQRKLPRGKDSHERVPPPVNDAAMWPTPESAAPDEKRTSASEKLEKGDETESKSPVIKSHTKEKWVKVDVKWEHSTPPTGARRGGRPGRGGRENGARGGAPFVNGANNMERVEKAGAPAVPRNQRQEDRGRTEIGNESIRSGSIVAETTRSSSAVTGSTDGTKPVDSSKPQEAANDGVDTKAEGAPPLKASSPVTREEDENTRARSNSKVTPRFNHVGSGYKGNNFDPARVSAYGDAHAHPRSQGPDRRSMPPELFTHSEIFGSDRPEAKGRGFGREKKDSLRDGGLSWRDREGQGDRPDRREPRSERGRGGYRGRGNHNNYGSHASQNQSWSTPLPQHPFPAKSHSYNERHRQTSAPFSGQMPNNSRSNPRSLSIPGGGFSNAPGYPQQPLSPSQQEFQPMFYQPMAYGFDYNLVNTMRMVQAQIEYYFSIENLCKDLFLRKHMDSQGFVLFSFITNFKRLRQLTDDVNLVRDTCAQIASLEYVRGDDGNERLRRRENWGQWLLPVEERDPSAQNAGPLNVSPAVNMYERYPQMYGHGYAMPPGQDMGIPPWMAGNQFASPVYAYGRNDFDLSFTGNPGMHNGGNVEDKDTHIPHDSKRNHHSASAAEPKTNGIISPHTGYASGPTDAMPKVNGYDDSSSGPVDQLSGGQLDYVKSEPESLPQPAKIEQSTNLTSQDVVSSEH